MRGSSTFAGPPQKRLKADASVEDFDDEELLALAQSQLPLSSPAPSKHFTAAAPLLSQPCFKASLLPPHNTTQEALDEEEDIAELVRLANSTIQPEISAVQDDDMPDCSTDVAARTGEASTSYAGASAPTWSGADIAEETISVTLKDGRRAFCRLHNIREGSTAYDVRKQSKSFLSAPISRLMQQVEQEAFTEAVKASKVQQADTCSSAEATAMHEMSPEPVQKALWVDKYSPQSFFELLSDEQVNREVIRWVKSWDACVHRKAAAQTGPMAAQPASGPEQKLLLLSGPPGVPAILHASLACRSSLIPPYTYRAPCMPRHGACMHYMALVLHRTNQILA